MEMKLGKENIDDKYKQGSGTSPSVEQATIPEIPMTPEQVTIFLEENLPKMRQQAEYDRLIIEQLTNDALLNRRPINQIPGLLGIELKIREIEALAFLAQAQQGAVTAEQELNKTAGETTKA